MHGERCENDPVPRPEPRAPLVDLQRTQESDPHDSTARPLGGGVKRIDTEAIPTGGRRDTARVHNGGTEAVRLTRPRSTS